MIKLFGRGQKQQPVIITDLDGQYVKLNAREHIEVEIASQISPAFLLRFHKPNNGFTTLTEEAVVNSNTFTVGTVGSAIIGDVVIISDVLNTRFFTGHVLAINGVIVDVDSPIDFPYTSGSDVLFASHNMNVNGSVTPQIFSIRVGENPANLQETINVDISKIVGEMTTTDLGDFNDFGNIVGGLPMGLVLRKRHADGTYSNIFNVRTNSDLAITSSDFTIYQASNPGIGLNGFRWELSLGGEGNLGTVIRIMAGEDLEFVVQDNLSSLTSYINQAQGSLVTD